MERVEQQRQLQRQHAWQRKQQAEALGGQDAGSAAPLQPGAAAEGSSNAAATALPASSGHGAGLSSGGGSVAAPLIEPCHDRSLLELQPQHAHAPAPTPPQRPTLAIHAVASQPGTPLCTPRAAPPASAPNQDEKPAKASRSPHYYLPSLQCLRLQAVPQPGWMRAWQSVRHWGCVGGLQPTTFSSPSKTLRLGLGATTRTPATALQVQRMAEALSAEGRMWPGDSLTCQVLHLPPSAVANLKARRAASAAAAWVAAVLGAAW